MLAARGRAVRVELEGLGEVRLADRRARRVRVDAQNAVEVDRLVAREDDELVVHREQLRARQDARRLRG